MSLNSDNISNYTEKCRMVNSKYAKYEIKNNPRMVPNSDISHEIYSMTKDTPQELTKVNDLYVSGGIPVVKMFP